MKLFMPIVLLLFISIFCWCIIVIFKAVHTYVKLYCRDSAYTVELLMRDHQKVILKQEWSLIKDLICIHWEYPIFKRLFKKGSFTNLGRSLVSVSHQRFHLYNSIFNTVVLLDKCKKMWYKTKIWPFRSLFTATLGLQ